MRCEVGGNIGRGALDLAPLGPRAIYVLELSSYQLELLETFRAHVAVWLNITPDHLDRHGDMAGYVAAKENIFARQQVRDCAVIGVDDAAVARRLRQADQARHRGGAGEARDRRSPAASRSAPACWSMPTATPSISPTCRPCRATTTRRTPPAPGRPAAGSACRARRSSRGLKTYPGLPHRQERVASRRQRRLRQRQQGDQRRRHGAGAVVLPRHLLDPRRPGEGGRRGAARAVVRPHPPCLPDRRGDRAVRRPARGQDRLQPLRRPASRRSTPRTRARSASADRAPPWCCCRRPAPRGTSGRATSSAAMRSAPWRAPCRARRFWGEQRDPGTARRPQRDRPMVVDRRPLVAGRHPGASSPSASC